MGNGRQANTMTDSHANKRKPSKQLLQNKGGTETAFGTCLALVL
jgi:hypothetical protein